MREVRKCGGKDVVLLDSISEIEEGDAGKIVVTGSHGGKSVAPYVRRFRPLLSVFNDAGSGKQAAGVASLTELESDGLAAIAVSHESARIGEAIDTFEQGVISSLNQPARDLGIMAGKSIHSTVTNLAS